MKGLTPTSLASYDLRFSRARALSIVLAVVFGALILRLYYLQCLSHGRFRDLSRGQHEASVRLRAKRGTIYDTTGNILAVSVERQSVFVDPELMERSDIDGVVRFLDGVLEIDKARLRRKIEEAKMPGVNRRFIWVARKIDPARARVIARAELPGVALKPEHKRVNPQGRLCGQGVGFVSCDNDGLEGVEFLYDEKLRGADGIAHLERDGRGTMLSRVGGVTAAPVPGFSVRLTIDPFIQHTAEQALRAIQEEYKPISSSAVALDVKTGAILAVANMPEFDPNEFSDASEESRRNRAVTDCYEPGSVMKPFAVMSALEEGIVEPNTRFYCERGQTWIGRRRFKDHHGYGWLNVTEIIRHSSNIGAAKIGQKCGRDMLYSTLRRFGFGTKTGVDLPGEVAGMLAPPSRWTSYSTVSITIGQEMAVTPLQLASGFAAIANEGIVMRPYVVDRVIDPHGNEVERTVPRKLGRAVSRETARDKMVPMLAEVVSRGTGRRAKSKLYTLAGKTGTAQKPLEDGSGYSHTKHIASFAVFGPVEDPRVCVVVMVNEKTKGGAYYGGILAAPAAGGILEKALQYLAIPRSSDLRMADAAVRR